MKTAWKPAAKPRYVRVDELDQLVREAIARMITGASTPPPAPPPGAVAGPSFDSEKLARWRGGPAATLAERRAERAKIDDSNPWKRPPVIAGKRHDHKLRCGKDCSARQP